MPQNYTSSRRFTSETMPGVIVVLKKMTEGRRLELRKLIGPPNRRMREILKMQGDIEKTPEADRDDMKWLELQDEFDELIATQINPSYITWGVKRVDGLVVDDETLDVERWKEWPSFFFDEVLQAVRDESELNGNERKNSESRTISGVAADSTQKSSTASSASEKDGGAIEIVPSTSSIE